MNANREPIGDTIDLTRDIAIICPQHGEFVVNAQAHLDGEGCPQCKFHITYNDSDMTIKFVIDDFIHVPEGEIAGGYAHLHSRMGNILHSMLAPDQPPYIGDPIDSPNFGEVVKSRFESSLGKQMVGGESRWVFSYTFPNPRSGISGSVRDIIKKMSEIDFQVFLYIQ